MQATTRKNCNLCLHLFQDRLLRLKIASTVLLVIYLSIWLKPLFPYIDFELNRDYIIKTLCIERDKEVNTCQGNCHLNKEIEENSTGETDDQNRVLPQSFESEIFYITLGNLRIVGAFFDVIKFAVRVGIGEFLALLDDLVAIVVITIIWNGDPVFFFLTNRVLDLEREFSKRRRFKMNSNLVFANLKHQAKADYVENLLERKNNRIRSTDIGHRKTTSVLA